MQAGEALRDVPQTLDPGTFSCYSPELQSPERESDVPKTDHLRSALRCCFTFTRPLPLNGENCSRYSFLQKTFTGRPRFTVLCFMARHRY